MSRYAGAVLEQLDRVFNRGTVAGLSEGKLLDRFVTDRDEVAFAALVARYGPMVLGVCRRILRNDQDVEDAFQATFLVLVRRAGAIRDGDLVSHWLHGVAHRVAVRAKAGAARRHLHEASGLNEDEIISERARKDDNQRELRDMLDQELARLPGTLRSPVVLCYLEGMTHDEAARRLRCPVGTVRSRLARARAHLRQRLARHGFTADGVSLSASLARPLVPQVLIDRTVRASLTFAAKQTSTAAVASASAAALAKGILHAMTITKFKTIGAVALASALAFGGVTTLARQFGGKGGAEQPVKAVDRVLEGEGDPIQKVDAKPLSPASSGSVPNSALLTNQKVPATPVDTDRLTPLFAAVEKMGSDLEVSIKFNERLRKDLQMLHDQIRDLQAGEPPVPSNMGQTVTTPRKGVDKRTQGDGKGQADDPRQTRDEQGWRATKRAEPYPPMPAPPKTFRIDGMLMVTSPPGDRVVMYSQTSGLARHLKRPVPPGEREQVTPIIGNSIIALLIYGPKVTQIAVFNREDMTWYPLELREGVAEAAPRVGQFMAYYNAGRYFYAFSAITKSWDALEVREGAQGAARTTFHPNSNGPLIIETDGHIYSFLPATGKWDDVDTRKILDLPETK